MITKKGILGKPEKLKEIFEFLKPGKWKVILTLIFAFFIWIIYTSAVLPNIITENLNSKGQILAGALASVLLFGLIIILYTIISLIVYFIKEEYKSGK